MLAGWELALLCLRVIFLLEHLWILSWMQTLLNCQQLLSTASWHAHNSRDCLQKNSHPEPFTYNITNKLLVQNKSINIYLDSFDEVSGAVGNFLCRLHKVFSCYCVVCFRRCNTTHIAQRWCVFRNNGGRRQHLDYLDLVIGSMFNFSFLNSLVIGCLKDRRGSDMPFELLD